MFGYSTGLTLNGPEPGRPNLNCSCINWGPSEAARSFRISTARNLQRERGRCWHNFRPLRTLLRSLAKRINDHPV